MKKRIFYNKFKSACTISIKALLIPIVLFSCRTSDHDKLMEGNAEVTVNVQKDIFDNAGNIGTMALSDQKLFSGTGRIQRQEIAINDDVSLVAELSPADAPVQMLAQTQASSVVPKVGSDLTKNMRYKLVVYSASGDYITERDYILGQETRTKALNLQGGNNYTFIAYSVNSAKDLPLVSFKNSKNKKLSNAVLSGVNGSSDFMYFRKDLKVSGNKPNLLNIVLKHKFCQITTTFRLDKWALEQMFDVINASFVPHFPKADIQLADANITRTGSAGNAEIKFGTSAEKGWIVSSLPTIINADTSNGSLFVSSLKIKDITGTKGSVKRENFKLLTGLKITPGSKYNLELKLKYTDVYIDHKGQKAVRIGGKIWMRHNLGVDVNVTPNLVVNKELHGSYYQFGQKEAVAMGTDNSVQESLWKGRRRLENVLQWNIGTENAPEKSLTDPCPTGYRVPTVSEFESLLNATTQSYTGTWSSYSDNYTAAKIMTSKVSENIKITFPIQGYFSYYLKPLRRKKKFHEAYMPVPDEYVTDRGNSGNYWTSSSYQNVLELYKSSAGIKSKDKSYYLNSLNIRCIAE